MSNDRSFELKPIVDDGSRELVDDQAKESENLLPEESKRLPVNNEALGSRVRDGLVDKAGDECDDMFVNDEDQVDRQMWIKLCPWLLKWRWFRERQNVKQKETTERLQWDNRIQYILTLVGYAVGLGNLWRFSYLVAKNGGATFIIPYFVMLLIVGIPMFYMESTLGQSLQRGPIRVWYKICSNLWGIGLSGVIVSTIIRVYYNVLIGWIIFYSFHFQNPLPWSKCDGYHVSPKYSDNLDFLTASANSSHYPEILSCINDSAKYFWYNNALKSSTSINHLGRFNWELMFCYFASAVIVYFCIFRGIKSSGKVVYVTATFPFIVMVIVFFRAVTLKGAGTGLKFLFVPEDDSYQNIFKPQIWLEAGSQILFSLGLSQGTIIALSSYSKRTNNNLIDSLIVCFTNSFTSIFASIIVFCIIGFKAEKLGTHPKLVMKGPGLAFIVITEAITMMPVPQLWTLLFFIMLFLLGLDSHFGGLEVLITVLFDIKKIKKYRRELVIGIICGSMFLLNLPFTLGNGFYLFQLVDQFIGTIPLLVIGICEIFTIAFVLGVPRFFDLVKYPVHSYLKTFWWFMWTFVSPVAMAIILLSSFIHELVDPLQYTVFRHQQYNDSIKQTVELIRVEDRIPFPDWAQFIGSVTVILTLSFIPGVLVYRLIAYASARRQMIDFWLLTKERAGWVKQKVIEFVFSNKTDHDENKEELISADNDTSSSDDTSQ